MCPTSLKTNQRVNENMGWDPAVLVLVTVGHKSIENGERSCPQRLVLEIILTSLRRMRIVWQECGFADGEERQWMEGIDEGGMESDGRDKLFITKL